MTSTQSTSQSVPLYQKDTIVKSRIRSRVRAASLLGAATIVLAGSGLAASPAFAAPGDGGTGSITVYKFEQPSGDLGPADGSKLPDSATADAAPVANVGFTTCLIDGVDLTDSAQWERLKNITLTLDATGAPVATENGSALNLTCGAEVLTSADGEATFTALTADRAYVVFESDAPDNAVTVAQPSLLTIPYPGTGSGETWNYNPVIYPKNVLVGSGATKDGEIIGDEVSFDITVPINPLAGSETYSQFAINDQLAGALTYTGASVVLTDRDGAPVPLTAGTDYTLTAPSGNAGEEVVLQFLAPGLAKLDANVGATLVLTINADATGSGSTANTAVITVNGATGEVEVVDPENFYNGAHVLKTALNKGAATAVPLAGAGFDVYSVGSDTSCAATPTGDPVIADWMSAGTTGATGDRVLAEGNYCVYETTVPAGYKGQTGGSLFTVAGEDASVTVQNTQIGSDAGDLPSLPMTGAQGTALLIGGGAALLLAASLMLMLARRRRRTEEVTS